MYLSNSNRWLNEQKENDLALRIEKVQEKRNLIEQEIRELKNQGELPLDGSWIVRYERKRSA